MGEPEVTYQYLLNSVREELVRLRRSVEDIEAERDDLKTEVDVCREKLYEAEVGMARAEEEVERLRRALDAAGVPA